MSTINFAHHILKLDQSVMSIRAVVDKKVVLKTLSLSGNTKLLGFPTSVQIKYNFGNSQFTIKGTPTSKPSISLHHALKVVSGTGLKVPSTLSILSQAIFLGEIKSGKTTIAIQGKSGENSAAVILQKSASSSAAAVVADIHQYKLSSLVSTAMGIDISNVPIFGRLMIPRLGYSVATAEIKSSLFPLLYPESSPLQLIGSTLLPGVFARFSLSILEKGRVIASLSSNTLSFQVPKSITLTIAQILRQINVKRVLESLPQSVTGGFNSKLSNFKFDPSTKLLTLQANVPQIVLLPNILTMHSITLSLGAVLTSSPAVTFQLYGSWDIGKVTLTTTIVYNRQKKRLHVMANQRGSSIINISTLLKNAATLKHRVPNQLASFTLKSVVGNIYQTGHFFIAMSGTISVGQMYLLFQKSTGGLRVGIAANVQNFHFSNLVASATGKDITRIPYLGSTVVPKMALVISSSEIVSSTLPHLFKKGSLLHLYGSTIPQGVTAQFVLNIGKAKGVKARFMNSVTTFKLKTNSIQYTEFVFSDHG